MKNNATGTGYRYGRFPIRAPSHNGSSFLPVGFVAKFFNDFTPFPPSSNPTSDSISNVPSTNKISSYATGRPEVLKKPCFRGSPLLTSSLVTKPLAAIEVALPAVSTSIGDEKSCCMYVLFKIKSDNKRIIKEKIGRESSRLFKLQGRRQGNIRITHNTHHCFHPVLGSCHR